MTDLMGTEAIGGAFDIVVAGAGPAGLLAGLAFAQTGFHTAICGRLPTVLADTPDTRTAALFNDSITMLTNLQVWPQLKADCAPIAAIRIIDDMGHILRGPQLTFDASSLNLEALGWNVPNAALIDCLCRAAADMPSCHLALGETIAATDVQADVAIVRCESGRKFHAKLVVAADGQRSSVRDAAGIAVKAVEYPQAAITSILQHSRPHRGISTEFHRPGGPFTVVPLPGNASSLVWLDTREAIAHAAAADDNAFITLLEQRLHGLLGTVSSAAPRRRFNLATMTTDRLVAPRVALIGETAHAFPPIGAQGLNLSCRDVAVLAEVLDKARRAACDIGAMAALKSYQRQRTQDIGLRAWGVDKLNRSLMSTWPGVNLVRGGFSHVIHGLPILKRAVMRAGLTGTGALPPLMQM